MNIFYLDQNIDKCAQYHADCHVIKMILESAQILCTVLTHTGIQTPYRPTHDRHPCVIWAETSADNWLWLKALAHALNQEYQYRYETDKEHASITVIHALPCPIIPALGLTQHAQAMPDEYKRPNDPIQAYRHYYAQEKKHLLQYTRRGKPDWLTA
jgi:hypothetical protein